MSQNGLFGNVKESKKNKYWIQPLIQIYTKIESVLSWPEPHPSTKFRGKLLICFCIILLTKIPTNKQTGMKTTTEYICSSKCGKYCIQICFLLHKHEISGFI